MRGGEWEELRSAAPEPSVSSVGVAHARAKKPASTAEIKGARAAPTCCLRRGASGRGCARASCSPCRANERRSGARMTERRRAESELRFFRCLCPRRPPASGRMKIARP